MLKAITLTLISAGVIGSQTVIPEALTLTAGTVAFTVDGDGFTASVPTTPDVAISITTKGDRTVSLRF